MAAVTLLGSTIDTNLGTHTVTATPAIGDLIVIVAINTGSVASVAPTDNQNSGLYTKVNAALKATSADLMEVYIRNFPITAASSTIFTQAPGTTTGGGIIVYKVTGMSRTGSNAALQSAIQSNQAAATPAPVFTNAVNTGNPVITAVFNATSPGGVTVRSSPAYTSDVNTGYSTPTAGIDSSHVNSGETAKTITWGGASASAFCSIAIELDTTTAPSISTLQDPLNADNFDTSKWVKFGTSANIAFVNNDLEITIPSGTTQYNYLGSLIQYNWTGQGAYMRVTPPTTTTVVSQEAGILYQIDPQNKLWMFVGDGVIKAFKLIAAVQTQIGSNLTYDSVQHLWFRLRESSGTYFFDTSPDASTWTNRFSLVDPFSSVKTGNVWLYSQHWQSETTTTTDKYSYFNSTPSASQYVSFLATLGVG